jgi:hypothetical protein
MIPHPGYPKIKNNVDFSFVEPDVAQYYSSNAGQPCIPPQILFRILF